MRANRHILKQASIPPCIEVVSETFTGLPIALLMDFDHWYAKIVLHRNSQDYMAIQTM